MNVHYHTQGKIMRGRSFGSVNVNSLWAMPGNTELLIEKIKAKWTYEQVAQTLGTSRAAVSGKVRGLRADGKLPQIEPKIKLVVHRSRPRILIDLSPLPLFDEVHNSEMKTPSVKLEYGSPDEFDRNIPAKQRLSLMQLTRKCCRWPVGETNSPDFFFCGAPTAKVYCKTHAMRAYNYRHR